MRLSDAIEAFIKTMMAQSDAEVELKRSELADYFRCAPSQITYVLTTRFSQDHGYVTESRRGGGGCIRISRLKEAQDDYLQFLLDQRIGDSISQRDSEELVRHLLSREALTTCQADLIMAALSKEALSLPIPTDMKDALRARILRSLLIAVAQREDPHDM